MTKNTALSPASDELSASATHASIYLTKSQVHKLWEAGSFLVQEYGLFLNARISIRYKDLNVSSNEERTKLIADLVHELGMALKRWAPQSCARFHWLYSHELGRAGGLGTAVIAHIPVPLADDVEAWLFDHFLAKRYGWPIPSDAVSLRVTRQVDSDARMRRHLQLMRLLCRAVDPGIRIRHKGERIALIDLFRIPNRWRGITLASDANQAWRVSRTIGVSIQNLAKHQRMTPLSAFGDKAFDYLLTGWERLEYQDRRREKEDRARAQLKIELDWREESGLLAKRAVAAALNKLRMSWPKDPRERLRTWRGWWLDVSRER